jgi:methyltransferase
MVSLVAFTLFVALVAIQRLSEVALSRRNEARLRARGAIEHAPWQVVMLGLLHGAWLASIVAEVWLLRPPLRMELALPAMAVFLVGQLLRLAAIRTLGERWTVTVMTLPATPRVGQGLYSWLRHPNYVGVALEIASLPLVHRAVLTAVVFTVLNAVALMLRLDVESRALTEAELCPNPMLS